MTRSSRQRFQLINRLMGMETEYAPIVLDGDHAERPSARAIYEAIIDRIREDQPTACGLYDRDQVFLASGGAVNFESQPFLDALPGGLIEIATPEVRSVSELVACQRSMDELVAEAASTADLSCRVRILKNSSDAAGHVYGCQENYETNVATGVWLVIYRCFVCLLWLLQVASFFVAIPLLILFAGAAILLSGFPKQRAATSPANDQSNEAYDIFRSAPKWLVGMLIHLMRMIHFPTVTVLRFVGNHVAFRPQRKYLTALLISRVTLMGTGVVDSAGRFRLSAKAMATDRVSDLGGFQGERPIFVYGHWLSQLCSRSFLSLSTTRQLFSQRQRLQIGLSDSNPSDFAEYVKIGSVAIVLDMIERGTISGLPILRQPLWSLQRIACDWNLITRVPTHRGEMSALDIQRCYYDAAKSFVNECAPEDRGEAETILSHWGDLLELLSGFRRDANAIESALGKIDWLSKHWMLQQLSPSATWTVRKKVDLKYHELSGDGYFNKLIDTLPEARLITSGHVSRRRRSPPADSPAARRGWLIREFAGDEQQLLTEWKHATIQEHGTTTHIDFTSPS